MSSTQLIQSGGFQQIAAVPQIIYLDFDGELTSYNGEILTVDEVTVEDSHLSEERIAEITAALNEQFSGENVTFVSDLSDLTEQSVYSTIYIGKTDAFEEYGNFRGLAETIDAGNQIQDDNAFVFLDSSSSNEEIISVIDHEIGHIVYGEKHEITVNSLADFASSYNNVSVSADYSAQKVFTQVAKSAHDIKYYSVSLAKNQTATITVTWESGGTRLNCKGYLALCPYGYTKNAVPIGKSYTFTIDGNYSFDIRPIITSHDEKLSYVLQQYYSIEIKYTDKNPDLSVSSLNASAQTVLPGQALTLKFSIQNKIDRAAASTVYIYDNGEKAGAVDIAAMEDGVSSTYSYTFKAGALAEGEHNLRVVADGPDEITEDNENNNSKSVTVYSAVRPDLSIAAFTPEAAEVMNNRPMTLSFSIRNRGTAAAASKASIYDGDTFIAAVDIDELDAATISGDYSYTFDAWKLAVGYHTFTVVADSGDAIDEFSENNNTATCKMYIDSVTKPDFTIEELTVSALPAISTEDFTLSFFVKNNGDDIGAASTVYLYDGTTLLDTFAISELAVGGSSEVFTRKFAAGSLSLGTHVLKVVADAPGSVRELNETNNSASIDLSVILPGITVYSSGTLILRTPELDSQILAGGSADSMIVDSGGSAVRTGVQSGGKVHVINRGIAENTTIADGGFADVCSGGLMSSSVVNGGDIHVSDGGLMRAAAVNSGRVYISSGGTADSAQLNRGSAWVFDGGMADSTLLDHGSAWVSSGGIMDHATVRNWGMLGVYQGGRADNTMLASGSLLVYESGTVSNTVLHKNGELLVGGDNGSAGHTTVSSGGVLIACSHGSVQNTTVSSGGEMRVAAKGSAGNTIIGYQGNMHVFSGGTASETAISSGGKTTVSDEGMASGINIGFEGWLHVSGGGSAHDVTVNSSGHFHISSGGTATGVTVNSSGFLFVSQGGAALEITENGGYVELEEGADAVFVRNTIDRMCFHGDATLHSGTAATNASIQFLGRLLVSNGGQAADTTVSNGGDLLVCSGGTAAIATVSSGGRLFVSGNGAASNITLSFGGSAIVSSRGAVNKTAICGGSMFVSDGGTAVNATVSRDGILQVSSGGTALAITENGGCVQIEDGGCVTFTSNTFNGLTLSAAATLHSGTTAQYITIANRGIMTVYSGGISDNASVSSGGRLEIFSSGNADHTSVYNSGWVYVSSGGTATDIYGGGNAVVYGLVSNVFGVNLFIRNGGTATSTTTGGWMYVSGIASSTQLCGGEMHVRSGGTAYDTIVNERKYSESSGLCDITAGYIFISSGGTASNSIINYRGAMRVFGGGIADHVTVSRGGDLRVSSGGTATNVDWTPCVGNVWADKGAVVTYARTYSGVYFGNHDVLLSSAAVMTGKQVSSGEMYIMSGGTADLSVIKAYGDVFVSSGGTAVNTVISGGDLHVSKGGMAADTSVGYSGNLYVSEGGMAAYTSVFNDGCMYVSSGGTAASTMLVGDFAHLYVSGGGIANDTTVNGDYTSLVIRDGGTANRNVISTGTIVISGGGTAKDTAVSKYGRICVSSGGTAKNTAVSNYGSMYVSSGGKIAGTLQLMQKAVVSAYQGAIIDFTVAEQQPSSTALIDDFSLIRGTPDYQITVALDQASGNYVLAGNASSFSGSISVKNVNNRKLGTLTAGSKLDTGTCSYSLALQESSLVLSVARKQDSTAPAITLIGNNSTECQSAVLRAETDDDFKIYYSCNQTDWTEYTGAITVTSNGTYYFKSADASGNIGYARKTFNNIDVIAPFICLLCDNKSLLQSTTLTAHVSEAASVYYSTDQENWVLYTRAITVTANGTYYFKAMDKAGNIGTNAISFANLDTEKPVITLTGDTINSRQSAKLTASADDGSDIYCSTDNENWILYTGEITVTANGTYYFKAVDSVGNVGTKEITFSNILPVVPEKPFGSRDGVSWSAFSGSQGFIVEYSADNFEHVTQIRVSEMKLDTWNLPEGIYQWRVKTDDGSEEWITGNSIVSPDSVSAAQTRKSDADEIADVFFAQFSEQWTSDYAAQHVGVGDWTGTEERVSLFGKNKISDIFEGSSDANILLMTDDAGGDALFVDDIYSAFPAGQQSRLAQIDEIRAGAGDDIVDMTSQQFEYIGDGLTIRGGGGNDTIWANKGSNLLFGDAGNDRLVGAFGNDVLAGGVGNDSMHGGGGDDIFSFCDNWGTDTVEQLADGTVTLWFAKETGSWNQDTMTYSDGQNSVKVTGVSSVTLKFGDDTTSEFAQMTDSGAFLTESSEKIFEENSKGVIVKL